jgi:hypothetical protein
MHVKRSVYCKDSERHEVTGESSRSRDEAAARSANATVDNETDARTGDGAAGEYSQLRQTWRMQSKLCWIGLGAVVVLGRSTGRRNWRDWRGSSLWGQEDTAEPGQPQRGTTGGAEDQETGAGDDGVRINEELDARGEVVRSSTRAGLGGLGCEVWKRRTAISHQTRASLGGSETPRQQ